MHSDAPGCSRPAAIQCSTVANDDWWIDETAHAGPEHLDVAYVAGYDAKSGTDWNEDVQTLLRLGIDSTSTVVDIGAGTGTFCLAIAPYVLRVIGVDVSPAMVEVMRSRGVDAVEAGFLSYEHDANSVDAVFSRNALHHLPDFWKAVALHRVANALRRGGILLLQDLIYSFDPDDAGDAISAWLAAAPTDRASGWTSAELAEHVRTEFSTFSWLLEPLLDRAGFDIAERWMSESRLYGEYVCIRR